MNPDKTNMSYRTNVFKYWPYLEKECLLQFIEYFKGIVTGNFIDGVMYYRKRMTQRQQGKVSGFANCLLANSHLIEGTDCNELQIDLN